MKNFSTTLLLVGFLHFQAGDTQAAPELPKPGEAKVVHFDGALPKIPERSAELKYDFDLSKESFEVFVPKNYTGKEPFGLFVFMDAGDAMTLPQDWQRVMEAKKLIAVIPQRIGNNQSVDRRLGLSVVGLLKAEEYYRIDPRRVFTSGMSGGARCALHLAIIHHAVISGSVPVCGADFYQTVPRIKATNTDSYGVWPATRVIVTRAKAALRIALVTGENDFRRGNITDAYTGGFATAGFRVMLLDVPGMGHQLCSPDTLARALNFVDRKD